MLFECASIKKSRAEHCTYTACSSVVMWSHILPDMSTGTNIPQTLHSLINVLYSSWNWLFFVLWFITSVRGVCWYYWTWPEGKHPIRRNEVMEKWKNERCIYMDGKRTDSLKLIGGLWCPNPALSEPRAWTRLVLLYLPLTLHLIREWLHLNVFDTL